MQEAQLNLQEKNTTVWGKCTFFFIFGIFIIWFQVAGKYRYMLTGTVAAVKQQVIVAVDMATFVLLIGSFLLDLFNISEAVIFMGLPLFYQKPLVAPCATSFLSGVGL